ncbi:universal stress protein [Aeromonas australiensis]|uniref:universal stress protein n=1 Tax=Aeromonas australiensis TaxID=1114880 RepID=UPI00058A2381|nr:universal stress protein [Aeromonas australiensis]
MQFYKRMLVVLSSDINDVSVSALGQAIKIAKANNSKITILKIIPHFSSFLISSTDENIIKNNFIVGEKSELLRLSGLFGNEVDIDTVLSIGDHDIEIKRQLSKYEYGLIIQFVDGDSWFNQIISDEHYNYILSASNPLLLVNSRAKRLFDKVIVMALDAKTFESIELVLPILSLSNKPSEICIATIKLNAVIQDESIESKLKAIATEFHVINSYHEREVLKLISSLESDVLVISGGESSIPLEKIIQKVLSESDCSVLVMKPSFRT